MKKNPESKARPCANCANEWRNGAANGSIKEGSIVVRGCCGTWQLLNGKFVRPLLRYSQYL